MTAPDKLYVVAPNRSPAALWCWISLGVLILVPSRVRAQAWPRADGLEFSVYVGFVPDRSLTLQLQSQVQTAITRSITQCLGAAARVEKQNSAAADEWFGHHPPDEVSPSLCESWGWDQRSKTILAVVQRRGSKYEVHVGEYDNLFFELNWQPTVRTLQREFVPELAGRLACQAWQPIGEIRNISEGNVEIYFPRLPRGTYDQALTGTILQIYGQLQTRHGIKPNPCRNQFLVVDSVVPPTDFGQSVSATLHKMPRHSSFLARHGDQRVRYLVRRLPQATGSTQVEVRIRKTGQPREGCEIFVANQPPTSDRELGKSAGLTNAQGLVTLPTNLKGLRYVSVRYADIWDTALIVPGVQPGPVLFQMSSLEDRLEYSLQLDHIRQEIETRNRRLAQLADEMSQARATRDVEAARKIQSQADAFISYDDLRYRAEKLRNSVRIAGGDSSGKIDRDVATILKQLHDLEEQGVGATRGMFTGGLRDTRVADLNERFALARDAHDWTLAGKLLLELAAAQPENRSVQKLAAAYSAASVAQSTQHAQARVTSTQLYPRTMPELHRDWPQLQPALTLLVAHDDRMLLDTLASRFDLWLDLVEAEFSRIKAIASISLPETEANALRRAKRDVEAIFDQLTVLIEAKNKLLLQGVLKSD